MNKDNKTHIPASKKTFFTYINYIIEEILENYGPSYVTIEEMKYSWQIKLLYKKEIEDFIILKTKVFLWLLDTHNSNYKDPKFLKILISLIADYLSTYTQNNPRITNRKEAKERLTKELYNQSTYIQSLLTKQAEKRLLRKKKQEKYRKIKAAQKFKAAQKNLPANNKMVKSR